MKKWEEETQRFCLHHFPLSVGAFCARFFVSFLAGHLCVIGSSGVLAFIVRSAQPSIFLYPLYFFSEKD